MDHVRLDPTRHSANVQPNAIATSFEGKRNPRDLFTGPDCLIAQRCSRQSSLSALGSSFLRG